MWSDTGNTTSAPPRRNTWGACPPECLVSQPRLERNYDSMGASMTEHLRNTPENSDTFDRLLDNRVEIAEFVNSFESERVQRQAFEAVVCSLGLSNEAPAEAPPVERLHIVQPTPEVETEPKPEDPAAQAAPEAEATKQQPARRRRAKAGSKRSFSIKKGLNFAPEGQPTLESFAGEKKPRNAYERCLVACYYLTEHMGLKADVEHVLAVFHAVGWPMPADPVNALQKTASTELWIDTSDMSNIKVVWDGLNHLTNKMPVEPKTKTG